MPRRAECMPLAAPAASTHVICRVLDSAREEVTDHCRDLLRTGLVREVARIQKMDYGTGNIAPERLGTPRQEKGIVLSPPRQEAWLGSPEVRLARLAMSRVCLA